MSKKYKVIRATLPIPLQKRGRSYRFPFDTLEVGECFIVQGMHRNTLGPYKCYAEKHLDGRKFITKKVEKGVAVWRVL